MAIVLVSGGFDPLHVGHVRMFEAAAEHGDLIVAINSDEWLRRKKGYVFMPWAERAEIIVSLSCVSDVCAVNDADDSVRDAIKAIKPDLFGNGGDRGLYNTPEVQLCMELGVGLLFNLGGDKAQSSSDLVKAAMRELGKNEHNHGH